MTLYQKVLTAYGLISESIATKMSEYAVAPGFSQNATYSEGSLVIRDNVLYMCVVPHSGPWDSTHFSQSTVSDAVRYSVEKQVSDNLGILDRFAYKTDIAPEFDDEESYVVGDLVVYENILYRCTSAHDGGSFDASHFSPSTVENALSIELSSVKASLSLKANTSDLPLSMLHVELVNGHGQLQDRAVNSIIKTDASEGFSLQLTLPPYFSGVARRFAVFIESPYQYVNLEWSGYDSEDFSIMTEDYMYPDLSDFTGQVVFEFLETNDHCFFVKELPVYYAQKGT